MEQSKEGTEDTANELRFDDKKDKEYLWFQAEKDYYRNVKQNAFDYVQKNETLNDLNEKYDIPQKLQ